MASVTESTRCPICFAPSAERFVCKSVYLAETRYLIRRCRDCGHHFARGPVDDCTLAAVYGGGFHCTAQQDGAGAGSPVVANARRRVAQLTAAGLRGRLLDIGAGKGYFVEAAAVAFEAVGLEYSDAAASAAREAGRRVETGAFPDARLPGSFDVITLWDVLAGFVDPHAAIEGIRDKLVLHGRLVLTVPWVSAPFARWTGRWWPLWIPPVNLHYFTHRSLSILLAAHGLQIDACEPEPKRVAVDFVLRKALRSVGLVRWAGQTRGLPADWSVTLNLGDIMTVYAQRAS